MDLRAFLRSIQINDSHCIPNIGIQITDNQIMDGDSRLEHFIFFVKVFHSEVSSKLMIRKYVFAVEAYIDFVIVAHCPMFTSAVDSSDWWVVRNLFCQKWDLFCDKFKRLKQKRIEWLACGLFSHCLWGDHESSDESYPSHRVLFSRGFV